ncbi:MAG TPA: hypothetical protein PLC53_03100, partial [Bacilli bacterium]|nr:hypothetical protein [Bacilli bacterium]
KEIIDTIKKNKALKKKWNIFENSEKIHRSNKAFKPYYYKTIESKKRYVIPLVLIDKKVVRLNSISNKCELLLNKYMEYKDSKYFYIDWS